MNDHYPQQQLFRAALAIICLAAILWCGSSALAKSTAITAADIKFSDPFEVTASIMEIDYGKDLLIVAENEIYAVDFLLGSEAIKTVLSNEDGRDILFNDLERGQKVRISGMKLSDGRVIAEELILLRSGR